MVPHLSGARSVLGENERVGHKSEGGLEGVTPLVRKVEYKH